MIVRLADVVTNPTQKGDGTLLPYVALEHLTPREGRLRTEVVLAQRNSSDSMLTQAGDVVFGKLRPYLVKSLLIEGEWCVSPELLVLRPTDAIDSGYLRYLTLSRVFFGWADATSYGVKMPRTSWAMLRLLRFRLPTLSEQRRIVAFLDEQCGQLATLLEEAGTYLDLVREREASSTARLLMEGTRGVRQQAAALPWLDAMPANWLVARLKYKARLESGHTPTRSREELWTNCVHPWISLNDVGDLTRNEYLNDTVNKISDAGLAASSARILPAGTVVLSRDATIGRSSIMSKPMATSQHFAAWVCGPEVEPRFLWLLFTTLMQPYLDSLTDGATLKTIGMGDLQDFRIPLPPLDEQREIVEQAAAIRAAALSTASELVQQIELLRERRESLITRALADTNDERKEAA